MSINQHQIASGPLVLSAPGRETDIVAMEILLPMGCWCETTDNAGITGLALRCLERGTKHKSAEEIAEALESQGSHLGSSSKKDSARIVVQTTTKGFESSLDLLLELLQEPTFPADQVEIEVAATQQVIREEDDNHLEVAYKLFESTSYPGHPYGLPSIGTAESVTAMTSESVEAFYRTHFRPDRMLVSLTGNYNEETVLSRLEGLAGSSWQESGAAPSFSLPLLASPETELTSERRETEAEWLAMGYPAPPAGDPDWIPLRVLNCLLGSSMDSRLFRSLREERGLVYQVGSAYPSRLGPSHLTVYLATSPASHDEALEAVAAEIDDLKSDGPDREELDRAQRYMEGTLIMAQESCRDRAGLAVHHAHLGVGVDFADHYAGLVYAVGCDDVARVAKKYLNKPVVAFVAPEENEAADDDSKGS